MFCLVVDLCNVHMTFLKDDYIILMLIKTCAILLQLTKSCFSLCAPPKPAHCKTLDRELGALVSDMIVQININRLVQ